MKTILVPIGGSDTDRPLFDTALAAASLFSGHLQFVHIHVGAGEAAVNTRHAEFAMGPALSNALKELDAQAHTRAGVAAAHFREYCAQSGVAIQLPHGAGGVTASWYEEPGPTLKRIMLRARHSDLVVVGRAKKANGLPPDFLEQLLIGCGRPVLISHASAPATLTGTTFICWKESPESARALGAAMPYLARAKRVVVASVAENGEDVAEAINDVALHLSWNGIQAETRIIPQSGAPVATLLTTAARDCGANLIVLGAYGHSRMHDVLFGSCTQTMIRNADWPVLLMH